MSSAYKGIVTHNKGGKLDDVYTNGEIMSQLVDADKLDSKNIDHSLLITSIAPRHPGTTVGKGQRLMEMKPIWEVKELM
jgi:hypothetical protein